MRPNRATQSPERAASAAAGDAGASVGGSSGSPRSKLSRSARQAASPPSSSSTASAKVVADPERLRKRRPKDEEKLADPTRRCEYSNRSFSSSSKSSDSNPLVPKACAEPMRDLAADAEPPESTRQRLPAPALRARGRREPPKADCGREVGFARPAVLGRVDASETAAPLRSAAPAAALPLFASAAQDSERAPEEEEEEEAGRAGAAPEAGRPEACACACAAGAAEAAARPSVVPAPTLRRVRAEAPLVQRTQAA
eukprot:TRINITY_DN18036_c0_g1_i1.p1 TRINITY_DN18036_c0_g1~~TRINITY_DN18036_c0_g1_i1.p1  ORF type:complete len:255 (+),score=42.03 TRINITY_DN18036_c0_g1_i1:494-1258(+)